MGPKGYLVLDKSQKSLCSFNWRFSDPCFFFWGGGFSGDAVVLDGNSIVEAEQWDSYEFISPFLILNYDYRDGQNKLGRYVVLVQSTKASKDRIT